MTRAADELRTKYLQLRSVVHDPITDLATWPVLVAEVTTMLDDRRQVGVLHVEVADLDVIESIYGWQVLDGLLADIASDLRESIGSDLPRETRWSLNRVGGDRFVAFVPCTEEGAEVDAAYLSGLGRVLGDRLDAVFASERYRGLGPRLRVLCGHTLLSENPYYRFERRVQSAIIEAREQPRRVLTRRERSTGDELRRIIDEAEVSILFHPVIDLETRREFGFEALVRGPKGSPFEMPSSLFAASYKVGADAALDRLCRDTALRECGRIAGRGKMFLNVLPDSLEDPAWRGDTVVGRLHEAEIDPADVILEISERDVDDDVTGAAAAIGHLRNHGYRFALDDVGTGYASIRTLQELRPDYVKVDPSLVREIDRHVIKRQALTSLVDISRSLGAAVIAEGVETEDEARTLGGLGVRYAQGFLFSHPAETT